MAVISWPSYYSMGVNVTGIESACWAKKYCLEETQHSQMVKSYYWSQQQLDKPEASPSGVKSFTFHHQNAEQHTLLCRQYLESWNSERDLKPHQSSSEGPTSDCHLDWGPSKWALMSLSGWLKKKKKKNTDVTKCWWVCRGSLIHCW